MCGFISGLSILFQWSVCQKTPNSQSNPEWGGKKTPQRYHTYFLASNYSTNLQLSKQYGIGKKEIDTRLMKISSLVLLMHLMISQQGSLEADHTQDKISGLFIQWLSCLPFPPNILLMFLNTGCKIKLFGEFLAGSTNPPRFHFN